MEAALELDLKQKLTQLSDSESREISAFLLRLRHSKAEAKVERSRIMKEMDAGTKTKLSNLQSE